eukprot:6505707-Pyramimonas_sp.AAC.1
MTSRGSRRHICNYDSHTERSLNDIDSARTALKFSWWVVNSYNVLGPEPLAVQTYATTRGTVTHGAPAPAKVDPEMGTRSVVMVGSVHFLPYFGSREEEE